MPAVTLTIPIVGFEQQYDWQIPSNNSNSNGFSSSITSITWDVDPTNSGDLPNVSALNGNSTYYWQMQTSDTNGDSAQVQ